ncbi:hypothetical protein [Micromonospora aurantiaca (nom. illeg.)]|uniref:hypothetical protein n=3 Tax=Micromonospora aurantiaca (nom. illeg.) TaxID=47850 RepID=UPI0037B63F4B
MDRDWLQPLQERDLLPPGALAAFVVGSTARGWDNARSDYDVYVIASREQRTSGDVVPVSLELPWIRTEQFYARNRRWQVTYWLDAQVDEIFDKVSWTAFESGQVTDDTLSYREEILLSRLGNCLLLFGQDWLASSLARLNSSAFRSFVVVRSLGALEDALEDALGQLEAGDLESATISARLAFGHVIDALLESHGEYGSQLVKWRPNRFRAADPKAIEFTKYWRIETMQDYDPAAPEAWIKDVLALCQDIAMRVETV